MSATTTLAASAVSGSVAATSAAVNAAASVSASASAPAASAFQLDTMYGMIPSEGGNMAFAIIFGVLIVMHIALGIWYKQRWIGVAFFFGLALELVGYASRAKAHDWPANEDLFLAQIITLTIAPCFVMGGYYYLLAKMVVIYGVKYTILPPIYYSYIFIFCDIVSLVLQGAGGGIAGVALQDNESTTGGTHIMIGGLAFQVFTMSMYLFFWLSYFYNIWFRTNKELSDGERGSVNKWHFWNTSHKEHLFNPAYAHIRQRSLFRYFPLVVLFGTIAIYIRCIYRVIELAQGWEGFLITHEDYVFVLDGMMVALASALIAGPFYPGVVFGRNNKVYVPKSFKVKKDDILHEESAIANEQAHQKEDSVNSSTNDQLSLN